MTTRKSTRHDQLRVFDSHGVPTGAAIELKHEFYDLGADATAKAGGDNFIVLPGSGIAPLHARLNYNRAARQWQLTPLTDAGARIGSIQIGRGETVHVDEGRDIWLGHVHAQLTSDASNPEFDGGVVELRRFEQRLSLSLLDFEERNRGLFVDASVAHRKALLNRELDQLIDDNLAQLNPETLNIFVQEALRRLLVLSCLKSGADGDVQQTYSRMQTDQKEQSRLLRARYIAKLGLDLNPNTTEEDIARIEAKLQSLHAELSPTIDGYMKRALIADAVRQSTLSLIFEFGPIQFFLDTPGINEIMVNGHDRIFIEKSGKIINTQLSFASETELMRVAQAIARSDNKSLTQMETMVDARLPGPSRCNIVINPTALSGTAITIRKFSAKPFKLEDLAAGGAMNGAMQTFLAASVQARKNILISGGTGTGKTTLLNALGQKIQKTERVVTIEDTAELALDVINLVSMEGRPPNAEGKGQITIQDMVRNALRMRPDRIIVGECRGGETLDMLQAMNTGHDGSMTTAHANNPEEALLRLETMVTQARAAMPVFAIRQQIAAAIDIIIQIERIAVRPDLDPDAETAPKPTFERLITQIAELGEYDPDTGSVPVYPIYTFVPRRDDPAQRFMVAGHIPSFFSELDTGQDGDRIAHFFAAEHSQ